MSFFNQLPQQFQNAMQQQSRPGLTLGALAGGMQRPGGTMQSQNAMQGLAQGMGQQQAPQGLGMLQGMLGQQQPQGGMASMLQSLLGQQSGSMNQMPGQGGYAGMLGQLQGLGQGGYGQSMSGQGPYTGGDFNQNMGIGVGGYPQIGGGGSFGQIPNMFGPGQTMPGMGTQPIAPQQPQGPTAPQGYQMRNNY